MLRLPKVEGIAAARSSPAAQSYGGRSSKRFVRFEIAMDDQVLVGNIYGPGEDLNNAGCSSPWVTADLP